jgi:hypothetical protein
MLVGVEASARNETLQWTHPDPSTVNGFRIYWRTSGGSTQAVEAGLPSVSSNTYSLTIANVPDTSDVYFSVRAFNTGGDSPASNEICRGPGVPCGTTTTPTSPPPPTDGGSGTSNVTFNLWDASTDTLVKTGFQSGDTITIPCAAIEIISPTGGSVGKTLLNPSGGSVPGACENSSPYGWENASAAGFECATSLGANGSYQLTVTTYGLKDCTGSASSVMLNFSVNVGGSPPPTGLGEPGKPYLVQ